MKNTITKQDIDKIVANSEIEYTKMGEKTTVARLTTETGFTIVESSSCVDPANYNQEMGNKICLDRITNKLWELEGYTLQKQVHEQEQPVISHAESATFTFKEALRNMKAGYPVCHEDFPGDGFWAWVQDTIYIFTRDGKAFPIEKTEDLHYTLGFIAEPKWKIHARSNTFAISKWHKEKGVVYYT